MKRLLIASALALACVGTAAAGAKDLKVLAIGNSFTQDACEQNLADIAAGEGITMVIGNLYIGSCTVERHCGNARADAPAYSYRKITGGKRTEQNGVRLSEALADEQWDVVVFQQGKGGYGFPETFDPWMGELKAYVRERVPQKARFLYQESWAAPYGSLHPLFEKYGNNQITMYEAIFATTAEICPKYGLESIPTATTLQNLRTSEVLDDVSRDGWHLNYIGRYAVACTWFEVITGKSVIGSVYTPAHLDKWQVETAREAAHEAVAHPTKIKYVGPEHFPTIWEEKDVPAYTLPDPLVFQNGKKVRNRRQWFKKRRPELLALFRDEMFGKAPLPLKGQHYRVTEHCQDALGGLATRKQVDLFLDKAEHYRIPLLIYLPNARKGPMPVFLGINFQGNWDVCDDPGMADPGADYLRRYGVTDWISVPWPVEQILSAGYGVVTFYRGDVDPDYDDGFLNGITPLIYKKGQDYPEPDQWGTISQWAWSLSRAMDYIETDGDIDARKVAVIGHSRLGKTALWAGACDERFSIVISNCSGSGGAALSRRSFGETVMDLNRHFPHWFCGNFRKYDMREDLLPFDQHSLMALVAPRPLYVCSAEKDAWADPRGEFLSALEASKVYRFLGLEGLAISEWPAPDTPSLEGNIGYHIHSGVHDCSPYDWEQYIIFADKYWK